MWYVIYYEVQATPQVRAFGVILKLYYTVVLRSDPGRLKNCFLFLPGGPTSIGEVVTVTVCAAISWPRRVAL